MARPRTPNNNRERMLASGIQLLKMHGYHGMSIKQLVDEIGVPKGSFYNYFPSKEEFVAAAINQYGEDNRQLLLQTTTEQGTARQQIESFFSALELTLNTGDAPSPCLISALTTEISQSSSLCRTQLLEVTELAKQHLAGLIEDGQRDNSFNSTLSADSIAALLYNSWHGQLLQYQLTGDKDCLQNQTSQLLDLFTQ
ncbi:MAG: TetR/AcrR family transcriptional regulator [Candidatus Pelagadaptatus aseana]|uniref:TetR/AcrR family transcriptional regulator n=1 Tax=Candidatus Pelagadaptatus aseana TaxID=3120508 RepID=UPI0039B20C96